MARKTGVNRVDAKRRVVLYGDTVVLAGGGAALSSRADLRVTSLDPSRPTATRDLDSLRPCAVILDLTVVTLESALALTRGRPDVVLIGLEPGGDRLVVLAGDQARAMTTEDLARLVETGVPLAGGESDRRHKARRARAPR
jgi:hypothetical protein